MLGSQIGSYRITKLLGEGGMGTVYQATDNIEREVAIKALRPQLTHDTTRLDRFRAEAVALGRLHHPNITSLFQLLEDGDELYMVMEFVQGQTLDEMLSQHGALPPRLALDILIDGLHGFEHAHSRGVVHRDIKASNLMISGEGVTKIMDFGIARFSGGARLTQTGRPLGTLEYMSPEQINGQEQDPRSDIYSLGILLFELLTGRVPFTDATDFELMRSHLEKAPPSVRHLVPSLPPEFDEIIGRALAKEPSQRYGSVAELREALEQVASHLPDASPAQLPTPAKKSTQVQAAPEKYGTRLLGSPMPIPEPAPPPPPTPTVPPAPAVVAPVSMRSKPAPRTGLYVALAAVGLVVLVGAMLAFRPRANNSTAAKPALKAVAHSSVAHPTAHAPTSKPASAPHHAVPKTPAHRAKRHNPIAERPKPHRSSSSTHLVNLKRSPAKIVKRGAKPSAASEKAKLRELIKGD